MAAPAIRKVPTPRPIDLAVVIAAGEGRRLRESSGDDRVIKPLTPLLGVPLVVRTLVTLAEAGVREVVLVTGYQAAALEAEVHASPRLSGLRIHTVHNDQWHRKNGISVLAARAAVGDRPFFLSMADHIYSVDLPLALRGSPPANGELVLAIDRRVEDVLDPEDAMWVKLAADGAIVAIGKDLLDFNAVDTGVFLTAPVLFEALEAERVERGGDCALADGVRRLARAGRASTVDVSGCWWQDVDTWDNFLAAERMLIEIEEKAGSRAAASRSARG